MIKTVRDALKVKEIREKLLFTFLMLIIVRIGSQLPIPGTDETVVASALASFSTTDAFSFFTAFTGGSLETFSVFALSISPYITSSIIMQLLAIAIPKLEEMQKDGETGRKKIAEITRYVTVALALIEASAMAIGFGNQGLFGNVTGSKFFFSALVAVAAMVAGSATLMWIGERITENGLGNGISVILLINIISTMPAELIGLFQSKVFNSENSVGASLLAGVLIVGVILLIVVFVVILQEGERRIAVQYAKKLQGRKTYGGQSTHIPLKVNTAGVIPVIFASSLMQFPIIISNIFGASAADDNLWGKILKLLSTGAWFDTSKGLDSFKWTLGFVIYAVLVVAFAYFYTAITFNPVEVANNMKKQGGAVPGIRPGKPTEEYLTKILNAIVFIGAAGLLIIATVPIIMSGVFGIHLSFTGTSLIIIVGVVIETLKKVESMMATRNYRGFLED